MEKVSIIVPVYKTEKYIDKCIESLVKQTYKNIEIILINDGSTDNCPKICDKWSKKDKRIKVIHKKNGGVSSARNIGIDSATGKYISFVDSDDYVSVNMLLELVNSIEKNNTDMAICNFYPNDDYKINKLINNADFYNLIFDKSLYRGYLWNKIYKARIIQKNNIKFDGDIHICEDLLFNCEYACYCKNISIVDKKLYYYNIDSDSALNCKINDRYLSVLDAYNQIINICSKTGCNMNNVMISYFKVITDLIYRNYISNCEYSMAKLEELKISAYKSIDMEKLSLKKRLELKVYNSFPIIIGNLRRGFKRRKK